jgi:hypothetical protein
MAAAERDGNVWFQFRTNKAVKSFRRTVEGANGEDGRARNQ